MAVDLRAKKGRDIANRPGGVGQLDEYRFAVRSESGPGSYLVSRVGGENWTCECRDYRARRLPCKHCFAAIAYSSKRLHRSTTFFDPQPNQQALLSERPGPNVGSEESAWKGLGHAAARSHQKPFGDRVTKGVKLARLGNIIREPDGSFLVPSETSPNESYKVRQVRDKWTCGCRDYQLRHVDRCKHAIAVLTSLMPYYMERNPEPPEVKGEKPVCPRCESRNCTSNGHTKKTKHHFSGKPLYHCKKCDKWFCEQSIWSKARHAPETVVKILDWYAAGISLRRISEFLWKEEGIAITHQSVWRTIKRWVMELEDFVVAQKPTLSGIWHFDEMDVQVRGGVPGDQVRGKVMYLWNCIDKETKFMLASVLSKTKTEVDAWHAVQKAMEVAKETPSVIVTDKNPAYPRGIERAFLPNRAPPIHWKVKGGAGEAKKGKPDNQQAENTNNGIRARIKTQRGWKTSDTPLRLLYVIDHNYLKPNRSLNGETPAERAGIRLKLGRNKFLGLLMHALGFLRFLRGLPPMTFPCLLDLNAWL